jgi:REP element-mobilizing transposase RayT
MKYNPAIHHRRSIRLKGYDYSKPGGYFITICAQNRECMFGEIENGEIILNGPGKMVERWWFELMNKFVDIKLDEYVIMPNHFHGIIINVGADLRVCPEKTNEKFENIIKRAENSGEHIGILGEHIGSPLHRIAQWFKTMTTNEYIRGVKQLKWKRFNKKLWQRNYYEHIIRNEKELNAIRQYIINNPLKWELDKENPKNINEKL